MLSAISVQWLGVVPKIGTIPRFSEVLKEHLQNKGIETIPDSGLKREYLQFLKLKKFNISLKNKTRQNKTKTKTDTPYQMQMSNLQLIYYLQIL